jgi:hypothetical protein
VRLAIVYRSLFARLRVDITAERLEIASKERNPMAPLQRSKQAGIIHVWAGSNWFESGSMVWFG